MLISRRVITSLISLLFLLCLSAVSQNAYAVKATLPLVETQWLEANLKKPGMRIIYIGGMAPNDKEMFDSRHIPGSTYIGISGLMNVLGNGSQPPDRAKLEALMGKRGVSNDTYVVLYGKGGNPFVTGALWLMKYFRHEKISILNGGMIKWDREGRRTTGEPANISPGTYKAGPPDESIRADGDYVLKNLNNPNVILVDNRTLEEYNGTNAAGNIRTGHLPGAVHLYFYTTNLKKDATFKSVDDLRALYESHGITKDKEIISYCQGGARAAHSFFVLKYLLGYPRVRSYVGSIGEWANRLDPAKYPLEK